nr:transposase (putative), gypsy type [Tanacetum cinerariifolium]
MPTQFPNQTFIDTPTSAYATYSYETSPYQEYLLKFTSEYGISEVLHPELPGLEDRIVDFPEGKVGVYTKFFEFANFRLPLSQFLFDILGYYQIHLSQLSVIGAAKAKEKYPSMLYQALRFPKKLEQPLLLGGQESVPDYYGLAYKCSEGRDAIREYVFPRGCDDTEHTSYPNPETTRSTTLLSKVKPRILPRRRGSTGPEDQEAAAPELPHLENVTTTGVALEAGQAEKVATTGPPVVKERRKRGHDGVDTNAPPKVLRRDHVDPQLTENLPRELMRPEIWNQRIHHLPPWPGLLKAYIGLNRQVAMGLQLRLRFEQEAKLLKKYVAQVARWDKRIQARENEIKNLETLLEAETDMKKAAENKSAELSKELENMRALFSDIQVSNNRLSQQVSTLQEQVMGEEKLKAAFEEFKQYENNRVEQRCTEMDARLDSLSIDFDEELYPHMLTVIASRRWVIGCGLRLAVMKCGESTELRQALADVVLVGIAKGMSEGLKHEARYPMDPWACKEEILLADAIAANVSRAENKKKCQVVCRTYGVGSAHHARSDGVSVSVPTVAPQGLAILLAGVATQTETYEDEASLRLLRSSSLPNMHT